MDFFKLFGVEPQQKERALGALFQELNTLLESRSEKEVKFVAGFAGLLGRVAYSDRDISQEELAVIKTVLVEETKLDSTLYDAVLEVLKRHTEELSGIEDHRYMQIINDVCSKDEKQQILNSLFAVAAADESVSFEEDSEISVIAKGLRLSHQDFIAARQRVRQYLDILKKK